MGTSTSEVGRATFDFDADSDTKALTSSRCKGVREPPLPDQREVDVTRSFRRNSSPRMAPSSSSPRSRSPRSCQPGLLDDASHSRNGSEGLMAARVSWHFWREKAVIASLVDG